MSDTWTSVREVGYQRVMPSSRDPWLDNAKMGLIVLVVVGHMIALLPFDGPSGHLYDFVYLWHMPAFVFLSGYLSRGFAYSPTRTWQLVTTLLVPYLLFEGALGLFRVQVGGEQIEDLWADPHFPMWYLLALVGWRLVTPLLRPLGGAAVPVAVMVSLAAGFLAGDWMRWMDLSRMLGFLPFFVLGLQATPDRLSWLRGRFPAVLGASTFLVIWLLAMNLERWADRSYLYQRPYELLDDSDTTAVLTRLGILLVGFAGTLAWLALVPRVGGWFTRMGVATMVVYLFHGFAVKGLEYAGFGEQFADRPWLGLAVAIISGVALALALAMLPVRRVLAHVADPFSSAERGVREAVELAGVVREGEQAAEPVPAAR